VKIIFDIRKQIKITFFVLIFCIFFFGITDIDISLQDCFFNHTTNTWLVDRDLEPYKTIFYSGIKKLLIFIGFCFVIAVVFFRKIRLVKEYKKGLYIVILSAILVPLVVGGLKRYTNMPCPKNELHYGGLMVKTALWQSYKKPYKDMPKISCWPAGHASGGFALMSLFFLFKTKRNRQKGLMAGLTLGWSMGIYKMLIGDHFLSHTIITMVLAWLIILVVALLVRFKPWTES